MPYFFPYETEFVVIIVLVIGMGFLGKMVPGGFIPEEDMGYLFVNIQLPDAASLTRTETTLDNIEQQLLTIPGVTNVISVAGYSLLNGAFSSNSALVIPILAPWSEREDPALRLPSIVQQAKEMAARTTEANVIPFVPPAIPGLGNSGGFSFVLKDFSGGDIREFAAAMRGFIVAASKSSSDTPGSAITPSIASIFR